VKGEKKDHRKKTRRREKTPCRDIKGCAKKNMKRRCGRKRKKGKKTKQQNTKPQTEPANCSVEVEKEGRQSISMQEGGSKYTNLRLGRVR